MQPSWIVIGVTGATCSGKTTLATNLVATLNPGRVHVMSQDDYFLDVTDTRHTWVPELNHIHFDIISSLDMQRMYKEIRNLLNCDDNSKLFEQTHRKTTETRLSSATKEKLDTLKDLLTVNNVHILIIEGFSIFDATIPEIFDLCQLKYFFRLNYDECKFRRLQRTYEPPDCDGYFEICVWPEYQKYLHFVQETYAQQVNYFESNTIDMDEVLSRVVCDVIEIIQTNQKFAS